MATIIAAILPVLVGAWQSELRISTDQAGYVGAAELFAQVMGTLLFLRMDRVFAWQRCAALGLALMVAGNLACAGSAVLPALLASRLIAGTGGGIVRALAMNCLGRARNPGRAFAFYASGQVALAASLTAAMPAILATIGLEMAFGVLAAACALAMLLLPRLPGTPAATLRLAQTWWSLPPAALLSLAGLFVFFVGQAAVWTYLAPLGAAEGISSGAVSRTLVAINFAGLAGTLGAGVIAGRSSAIATIACLMGGTLISVLTMFHASAAMPFALAACLFYFSWCASLPLQFALIAQSDGTGRAAAAAPAVDGLGLACGAALGGALIAHTDLGVTGMLCGGASVASFAAFTAGRALGIQGRARR
jgi:predicted MFS family arabinose efflux permease